MNDVRLIIFDLDGVLIESRELHYKALNRALQDIDGKYVISREEHLSTYDGLPTTKKLQLLTQAKGLPTELYDQIWRKKQEYTQVAMYDLEYNPILPQLFIRLKQQEFKIAVASNAIRETIKNALLASNLIRYVDYWISNEDVKKPKPYPEMFWRCMEAVGALPKNTWIVEDSHIGRQCVINSGAHLIPVENSKEVTVDMILNNIVPTKPSSIPWRDKKLNVLIPMAGAGSRFTQAGFTFPKPLIEINGKPMIQVVVENLNINANYIFICQKEHYDKYHLTFLLNLIAPGCTIITTEGVTEGAACTALLAEDVINNYNPLLIANSDQFVEWNANEVMYAFSHDEIDGGILTFDATHPRWSYAKVGDDGFVNQVAEKKVISNHATCGIYFWKHGNDFCRYAHDMIEANERVNGEFYIAPVYNQAIADSKHIRIKQANRMWGLGTPEDLAIFLENHDDGR